MTSTDVKWSDFQFNLFTPEVKAKLSTSNLQFTNIHKIDDKTSTIYPPGLCMGETCDFCCMNIYPNIDVKCLGSELITNTVNQQFCDGNPLGTPGKPYTCTTTNKQHLRYSSS